MFHTLLIAHLLHTCIGHQKPQEQVKNYWCSNTKQSAYYPNKTHIPSIPAEMLGNTCANTGNFLVCRTNQFSHIFKIQIYISETVAKVINRGIHEC